MGKQNIKVKKVYSIASILYRKDVFYLIFKYPIPEKCRIKKERLLVLRIFCSFCFLKVEKINMEKIKLIALERVIQFIYPDTSKVVGFRFLLAKREERKRTKPFARFNPSPCVRSTLLLLGYEKKKFYYADCYLKDASAVKIVSRVTTRQNTVTGSEPASASSLYVSFSHFSREKRRPRNASDW